MEDISGDIKTWLHAGRHITNATVDQVRSGAGFRVRNFADLITKVAHLSFGNPNYELLFRGQGGDYKNKSKRTTLLPSLMRTGSGYLTKGVATKQFNKLSKASELLCDELKKRSVKGVTRLVRYKVLQWSILQHYEVCGTPLLDVTHSLRVACSFSKMSKLNQETCLYVLAIPYLSGCITTSGDQGLQTLRLLSVCPPIAHRPHFQEGYLIGEYPDVDFSVKARYPKAEFDFARRLLCKFILPPAAAFWNNNFHPIPDDALYPPTDPFLSIAKAVKNGLK